MLCASTRAGTSDVILRKTTNNVWACQQVGTNGRDNLMWHRATTGDSGDSGRACSRRRITAAAFTGLVSLLCGWCYAQTLTQTQTQTQTISVLYLEQQVEQPPVLSNILPEAADSGLKGAELGVADNNTAGRFLNLHYQLDVRVTGSVDEALAAARSWLAASETPADQTVLSQTEHSQTAPGQIKANHSLIIANLPTATLLALMDLPEVGSSIVFNTGSADDELRVEQCRPGLLHTLPSRAMLADALVQFLIARRWNHWLLIQGGTQGDAAFARALQRAGQRFGGVFVDIRTWKFDTDLRRTAQQELPLFTQTATYQVTLVADELGDVGEYVLYNTWHPRPVAGTQGLTAVAWHRVVEQWGAAQLQSRFEVLAGRWMNSKDYAAWVAMRAIAEAVTQAGSIEPDAIYRTLLGDGFQLAGFKGRSLSFRSWNGQLRQPIPLVHPRALVSQSPQEGFLHPVTDLDTLGYDRAETRCRFNP